MRSASPFTPRSLTSALVVAALVAIAAPGRAAAGLTANVQLAWAFSARCPPVSGCTVNERLQGVVEVKNLGYAKDVKVVYQSASSQAWMSVAATYLAADPANPGYEAWSFVAPPALQFAISYTVNGTTYWDNNGGGNYTLDPYNNDAWVVNRAIGGMIGTVAQPTGTPLSGWVLVQNRAYQKSVQITWTDDSWSTKHVAQASYSSTYRSGVELWSFTAPLRAGAAQSSVQLASSVSYSGGAALWDNDFGRNYRLVNNQISW